MCGIAGQYNFGSQIPVDPSIVRRMTDSLVHRGPDDDGFYFEGPLGLGFRRLSIIDLAGGHQPMSDPEKSVWVVFNGEIYNFPELKRELEAFGFVFRTQCDTEVIVNGYKKWGVDVFSHLNGMFGLAIWDVARKRLVIARDAFGIKLVYYRLDNGSLSFGSEIRAVQAADSEKPEIDTASLNLFLRYRFTPSPFTIYKGIQKLPSGTMMIVENGSAKTQRWYNFKPEPFAKMPSDEEAKEQLLAIYRRAVKRHLLSDVPVGLLLSGGMDSGLLLGLMNESGSGWPTYTIGYGKEFKDDELSEAAESARIFGAKHTSIEIDRNVFEESLPQIVSCLEEPVAASSIVPMYFVSQCARQDVKVALNGQGPDEIFGGYKRHIGIRYGRAWSGLPLWMRKSAKAAVNRLPRNETLKRGVYSLDVDDRFKRYQQVLSLAPGSEIDSLFHEGLLPENAGDRILESWKDLMPLMGHTDELGGFQFLEVRSTLPDELLMYADKLSMAHSLEVRVPYLDREVVEYAECLEASFKVRRGHGKWLHREVCRSHLPAKILNRKKRGFAVNVVDHWLKESLGSKFSFMEGNDSPLYKYFHPESLKKLQQQHSSGERDNHKLIFSLMVFEQFLTNNVETSPPRQDKFFRTEDLGVVNTQK
jgi:asparagine synthase (glutamine-hydrolysing)